LRALNPRDRHRRLFHVELHSYLFGLRMDWFSGQDPLADREPSRRNAPLSISGRSIDTGVPVVFLAHLLRHRFCRARRSGISQTMGVVASARLGSKAEDRPTLSTGRAKISAE